MQRALGIRLVGFGLAGLLLMGAAGATTAQFLASSPGSDLEPVGGASSLVDLVQSNESVLWSSLSGTIDSYTVLGWPTSQGEIELGGAMVLERPADGSAGVIDIGEKPMSISFSVSP